jgi:rubredoxin
MKCPECGAVELKLKKERYEHQEIGWADGLGSPGTITHRIQTYLCVKCLHVFDKIKR